ncbi:hypothetical protein [Halobaculum sp. D14]|uniref:DUF7838 family putative zinc beta-ribbon protein n=1 Tax=unclassified Halobaculum TaxID=2640896 RepID=UPI003EBE5F77
MSLEMTHECPECGEEQGFWRVAAMTMHLGEKTKWRCNECDYGFVRINEGADIDSSRADL